MAQNPTIQSQPVPPCSCVLWRGSRAGGGPAPWLLFAKGYLELVLMPTKNGTLMKRHMGILHTSRVLKAHCPLLPNINTEQLPASASQLS